MQCKFQFSLLALPPRGKVFTTGLLILTLSVLQPPFSRASESETVSFSSVPDRDWKNSFALMKESKNPVAAKLLTWLYATETNMPLDTKNLMAFTERNSDWPRLHKFRARIEKDITSEARPTEIAEWFNQNPPASAEGLKAAMNAFLRLGDNEKARAVLKKSWLTISLGDKNTVVLAETYHKFFSATAHIDRLDNLLWEGRTDEAEAMLPLVDKDHANIARARMALANQSPKAQKFLQIIQIPQQHNEGLLYERVKTLRRADRDDDAFRLLQQAPSPLSHPELWWKERNILVRRALEDKNYARAYAVIKDHGMTSGVDFAQAEWTAGWLQLRFLKQPDKAYQRFERMYQSVTSAVSKSRAAYWTGRAADALHHPESAQNWYKISAQFPSTFYGQISYEHLYGSAQSTEFPIDFVAPDRVKVFDAKDTVRAVRLLSRVGLPQYIDCFLVKMLDNAKERKDFYLIAKLATETGRYYYTVEANKQLQQKTGEFLFIEGYPLLPPLPVRQPEQALIHAIVHRESMFNTYAQSTVGARGLMQLMPATARQVSGELGLPFSSDKLTENPQYNVSLGAGYLQGLVEKYSGFYPMAIAAYNAGPGNVAKWQKQFGDPRSGKIDIIDWIEEIPIYETRNYVQRVMESYYMYKIRFHEKPKTVFAFIP